MTLIEYDLIGDKFNVKKGEYIQHFKFGGGIVKEIEGLRIYVDFQGFGIKCLHIAFLNSHIIHNIERE